MLVHGSHAFVSDSAQTTACNHHLQPRHVTPTLRPVQHLSCTPAPLRLAATLVSSTHQICLGQFEHTRLLPNRAMCRRTLLDLDLVNPVCPSTAALFRNHVLHRTHKTPCMLKFSIADLPTRGHANTAAARCLPSTNKCPMPRMPLAPPVKLIHARSSTREGFGVSPVHEPTPTRALISQDLNDI
jgi:hypothetical protein